MTKKKSAAKPKKPTASKKVTIKKAGAKKIAVGKVAVKTVAAKQAPTAVAKKAKKKSVAGKTAQKSAPTAGKKPTAAVPTPAAPEKPEVSLGRPLVTQEEKLYMLFHDDYQARQVFEFLRVETVKELEEFSQQQIVHMMSKPLRTTVDRIRQRLAQFKRSLKDDESFAAEFRRHADEK